MVSLQKYLQWPDEAEAEPGVEVAVVDKGVPTDQMGPQVILSQIKTGVLNTLITRQRGAVERTGNGARMHIIAATLPSAPGRTGSFHDPHNRNRNRHDKMHPVDRQAGSGMNLMKNSRLRKKLTILQKIARFLEIFKNK